MTAQADVGSVERDGELLDIRSLLLILRRRLKLFLVITGVVFLLGVAVAAVLPDKYTATANVLIDRQTENVVDITAVLSGLPPDSASVDTETQNLQSPALLMQVVKDLHLDRDPEFNTSLAPTAIDRIKGMISALSKMLSPEAGASGQQGLLDKVEYNVSKNLSVSRVGLSYVIQVTFFSQHPKTASKVANAIADEYVRNQLALKQQANQQAVSFLQNRIGTLQADVRSKTDAAETAREASGVSRSDKNATFDEAALQNLSTQVIQLRADLAEKEGRLQALKRAPNADAIPEALASNTVMALRKERADIQAQADQDAVRYGPLHPETDRVKRQLAGIDEQIRAEISRISSSLQNDVDVAQRKLAVVEGAFNAQKSASVGNAKAQVKYDELQQEAQASATLYDEFLKRAGETPEQAQLIRPDARVINRAVPPTMPSLYRILIIVLALIAGCGLACVGVLLAELLDSGLSSGRDIERWLGLPRIASVPMIGAGGSKRRPDGLVVDKPFSSYAEAIRSITTSLLMTPSRHDSDGVGKIIMIASALPMEGKTTVAASLATSLAAGGDRVLLVDADLRRPSLGKGFSVRPSAGLVEVLTGRTSPTDAIVRDDSRKLDLLLVTQGPKPRELFRSATLEAFLKWARSHYQYVIIDTPPVLAVNDPRIIAPFVDAVLLVTRWRRTSRFAVITALEAFQSVDAPLTGVVLNQVDLKAQSLYARYDASSYYSSYRSYYAE
jgi:capsular exopolysaccharide synthesis family protein